MRGIVIYHNNCVINVQWIYEVLINSHGNNCDIYNNDIQMDGITWKVSLLRNK